LKKICDFSLKIFLYFLSGPVVVNTMDKITLSEIGERLKKMTGEEWSPQRVWWVVKGKKNVKFREALLIEKASGGRYKVSDLCADYKAIVRRMKQSL
jgi:hypothetical protein